MGKRRRVRKAVQARKPVDGKVTLFAIEEGEKEEEEKIPQHTYRVVGNEVLSQKLDPKCWAKALATGVQSRDEALSVYAKLRAEELAEKTSWKENKAKALEERRLVAGAPESEYQTRIIWRKRFSLMWDFLFWQILLSVSGVGLFLGLLAMGPDSRWWPGLLPLVVVSACLQLSPMIFYGLGKLIVGRVSYTQALGVTAVLLISLGGLMGVQILNGKQSPRWVQLTLGKAMESNVQDSAVLGDEEF